MMSFRPHMVPWGPTAAMTKRRPSTPKEKEPSPEDDADDLQKHPTDSDHETASASSSEPTVASSTTSNGSTGVASSFARAGKLFWGAKNPLSGLAALTKQHSRTVTDFSEADFTTPFASGTPVFTRYGLGTVATTRSDDGFLVVDLQCVSKMTLYLNPADEDYYSVPALRHDWVETPAGEGLVVAFDPKQQSYRVRIGGTGGPRGDVEVNVHRSDLRRLMPVRRQPHQHHPQQQHQPEQVMPPPVAAAPTAQEPSALTKGFNSAFKTIVTTSSGLTNSLSNLYYHGQYVATTFGSGTIVTLDQTSHRVQVQLVCGAMAYLHTDAILCYTKFLVGMDVMTAKFGSGVITDMRPADGMYTIKLHALKDGVEEIVYVHESDLVRGRRPRLGSASKNLTEKIGASKLFSFAHNMKLFGGATPAAADTTVKATPSPAFDAVKTPMPEPARPTRSKSVRHVEEEDDDVLVSSAGI